ncbi:MAG: flagellar type III secretion system pore protein FliP [Ignavibacteriales bacterium]|nr:MAG: flagellar biosynthetic protein FliP [Stygiobacter sp.]KAF0216479.1 MAG: flagellar biosynthetic protein [Ignavibacteria bacterium]MBI3124085.1 flagellar type III secretion system pore protein FliP [Ignavibacteriales bacterium]OGU64583.1 MAG: flagellar biosynthetic protein FliP [Stygiobacter sp. GWC2_38_9]OGU77168.1 MAG: flagellar biosynthetic protein FliP [Stygiobacter sp. RIFOXYA12_FULL_38_9]OGV07958.1 MAG: flagellar biosynthetic protein FliP [Stygiobacter sp. RIFOXYB2_FULL_37_11]OGV1
MSKKFLAVVILLLLVFAIQTQAQQAQQTIPFPKINLDVGTAKDGGDVSVTLQILLMMTILSLAPSIVIMTTSYLRIIIVFHFLKSALGTQQMPPSQLLAGVALFLTFFVMAPTWNKVNDEALKPLMDNKLTTQQAYDKGIEPIRQFMFKNVRDEDLELFIGLSQQARPATRNDVATYILIPAFVLSELRAGFIMGFFLFIPFIMVDMIVSSILMSMGMMMMPPMMISLPFKILLFILVDGWNLIVSSLVRSFH